jgi:hypothetical protein
MTRGTRGSAFNNKISSLERAKDQNPFSSSDNSFSSYVRGGGEGQDRGSLSKSEKGDSKGFLDKFIGGGLDYFKKTQEKSDTDKLIDFAKSQQQAAQFGDFAGGAFKEVADGLSYGQLPSQTQQMFIPGQQAQGKSLGQRFAGALKGGISGFTAGGPLGAAGGALAGAFL